jgi:probable addiction module antidote protein
MTETLISYDPAEDLDSPEAIAIFLTEALKTQDAAYIAHAIGVIARAQGMSNLAQETGLSREQLYRSYSKQGNPTLKSTLAVLKSLGLQLSVESSGSEETVRQPAQ